MSAPGSRRIGRPPSARKHFGEQLRELFDDGTGQLHPGLAGLYGDLVSMPEPGHGRTWLRNNPTAAEYLRGLARGDIPLTHDARHDLPSCPPRTCATCSWPPARCPASTGRSC